MNIEPTKIKTGDLMAIIHYVKVKRVSAANYEFYGDDVDQSTNNMRVQGRELLESAFSADQFAKEEKITKTQAAEILTTSYNRPFTVSFEKSDGTERTLRGRLVRPEPLLGRSMVEDLDAPVNNRVRQVDHRTINWIIVENVKHVVK